MVERIGLRFIEPPGWATVPLDSPTTEPLRALAHRIASASTPKARASVEQTVFDQLVAARNQARESGGQDLLLPVELFRGLVLPISVVIAATPSSATGTERAQSDALLAHAAKYPGSTAEEVAGSLAVRSVTDVDAVPGTENPSLAFSTRRVTWLIAAPIPTRQLLVVTGSIQRFDYDSDGEILKTMELLFDSIVRTIHFEPVKASA